MRDLSLSDVLRLVRRWWWVFILCPLLAGGAAYGISTTMTPIYEADTTLLIDQSQSPGTPGISDIDASRKLAATYSQLVKTRPVLDATISRLGLTTTHEALTKQISVAPVGETQLLRIAVTDPDPAQAARTANALAQVFIEQTRADQSTATSTSREELERNIATVKGQIDSLSARIAEIQQSPDAASASRQAELSQLQAQLSQAQATYTSLLEAQQRMDIAAAQTATQIRVVEPATPPTSYIRPRILLNTALATILGLLVAGGLVLVVGYLDDTVKTSDDVRRLTGRSALGQIPSLRTRDGVEAAAHPNSAATEAYRSLRTNLQFATVSQPVRTLVVTSVRPGDGKTSTIVNLAAVLAQGGQRVILVDADLRKPQLRTYFGPIGGRTGLTNLLLGAAEVTLEPLLRQTTVPNLRLLPAGPLPPNPPDVLNSPRMRQVLEALREHADVVLFDAPPLAVSDALIIGSLVDGILLVAQQGRTRSSELVQAVHDLAQTGTPLVGVVLNRIRLEQSGGYYAAYYRSYYGSEGRESKRGSDAIEPDAPAPQPLRPLLPPAESGSGEHHGGSVAAVRNRIPTGFARRLPRRVRFQPIAAPEAREREH